MSPVPEGDSPPQPTINTKAHLRSILSLKKRCLKKARRGRSSHSPYYDSHTTSRMDAIPGGRDDVCRLHMFLENVTTPYTPIQPHCSAIPHLPATLSGSKREGHTQFLQGEAWAVTRVHARIFYMATRYILFSLGSGGGKMAETAIDAMRSVCACLYLCVGARWIDDVREIGESRCGPTPSIRRIWRQLTGRPGCG